VAKRGFFAELQHQARLAEQQRRREMAAHSRALAASQRSADQAQRAAERSYAAAVRMSAAEQKLAQAEAKRLHEESMEAQAELQTLEVTNQHNEIAGILQATLGVDDFVDLETLRVVAQHPPFSRPDLQLPMPLPAPIPTPDPPLYQPPARPSGMSRVFGGNKKFDEATAAAQAQHAVLLQQWQDYTAQIPTRAV
jgi:restriction system protein